MLFRTSVFESSHQEKQSWISWSAETVRLFSNSKHMNLLALAPRQHLGNLRCAYVCQRGSVQHQGSAHAQCSPPPPAPQPTIVPPTYTTSSIYVHRWTLIREILRIAVRQVFSAESTRKVQLSDASHRKVLLYSLPSTECRAFRSFFPVKKLIRFITMFNGPSNCYPFIY